MNEISTYDRKHPNAFFHDERTARASGRLSLCVLTAFCMMFGVLWSNDAIAAVSMLDAFPATPQINNASSSPATTSYTPSAGTYRLIVIEVTNIPNNTTNTAISVTYGTNNVPATAVVNSATNQRRQAWLFYLTDADIVAATGNTVTVTNNNAAGFSVNIATFEGVDQTTPVTASDGRYLNAASTVLNYTAPLNVNDGGYGIIAAGGNTSGGTIGESYVDHGETAVGNGYSRLGSKAITAAGTTDPGIDYGTTSPRAGIVGMTLNAAAVAGPGTIQFTTSSFSVNEAAGPATITVSRTGGSTGAVGISYTTTNGTATAGSDYATASGTLSWADGDTADKSFPVTIINDTNTEGNEDFTVTLSSPTGGAVIGGVGSAAVTIIDDETVAQVPASSTYMLIALFIGMAFYVTVRQRKGKGARSA